MNIWCHGAVLNDAERDFMTTRPTTAAHVEFLARAAKRYPGLPAGAQQAALYTLETFGAKAAASYASHARARWPKRAFQFVMPAESKRGICTYSIKERDERLTRYRAHMSEGQRNIERERLQAIRAYEMKMAAYPTTSPYSPAPEMDAGPSR